MTPEQMAMARKSLMRKMLNIRCDPMAVRNSLKMMHDEILRLRDEVDTLTHEVLRLRGTEEEEKP